MSDCTTMYHPEWEMKKEAFVKTPRPIRDEVLTAAKMCVCEDRNKQYGEPENNFEVIAELWNQYIRRAKGSTMKLSAYDVGMMMALFKVGRMESGKPKRDSFVDAIGYIACAAEIVLGKKGEKA